MPWLRRLVNTIRSSRLQRDIDREIAFIVAAVVTVACIAAVVPAARAALVQPMRALREE